MAVWKSTAHRALPSQDSIRETFHNEELDVPKYSWNSKPRRRTLVWFAFGIISVAIFSLTYRLHSARTTISQCGTSPEQARAKGCVFETMGFSWLPEECSDPAIEAQFLLTYSNIYYRDQNYTDRVPLHLVQKGDIPLLFVRQDYHRAHCAFLFKKMHKALDHGKKIDGLISPLHHTSHCVHMLLGEENMYADRVQVAFAKYPYCGKHGGYNTEWSKQMEWVED